MTTANGFMAVGIEVTDLERSTAFYVELLGFEVQQRIRLEHVAEHILVLPGASTALALMTHADGSYALHPRPPVKVVVTVADIEAALTELRTAGHPIDREPMAFPGFGLIAFSRDPDGYAIELIQPDS